jgi:hypothetical protein
MVLADIERFDMDKRELYKLAFRRARIEDKVWEVSRDLDEHYEMRSIARLMVRGGRYAKEYLRLDELLRPYMEIKHKAGRSLSQRGGLRYPSLLNRALCVKCHAMDTVSARRWQSGLWPQVLAEYRRTLGLSEMSVAQLLNNEIPF